MNLPRDQIAKLDADGSTGWFDIATANKASVQLSDETDEPDDPDDFAGTFTVEYSNDGTVVFVDTDQQATQTSLPIIYNASLNVRKMRVTVSSHTAGRLKAHFFAQD